jgi:hypothetical protein
MADAKDESTGDAAPERKSRKVPTTLNVAALRTRAAQLLWIICVVFALFLAVGALTYALDANEDNALVDFVRTWADRVDLGVFSQENGIKEFVGKNSDTKNALFNWGLGAVFWLVLGRVLDRVVRP